MRLQSMTEAVGNADFTTVSVHFHDTLALPARITQTQTTDSVKNLQPGPIDPAGSPRAIALLKKVALPIPLSSIKESPSHLNAGTITLCVLSVDIQNPLCAFHTLTVVSEEADITKKKNSCNRSCFHGKR